ncbi:MAG: SDR family NAD(P)-dependent oxidoreductase [Bacteroidota bacterium]
MAKTVLITGSTDGIGKLTAKKVAESGHKLYLHGRNQDKLQSTITELRSLTRNESIEGFVADFSSLNAVAEMAGQIKKTIPSMDVLINNAGVYKSTKSTNDQGLDLRIVVNYLAPYKLTMELLSLLKASKARIINLSSAAQAPVSTAVLSGQEQLSVHASYAQSKLELPCGVCTSPPPNQSSMS